MSQSGDGNQKVQSRQPTRESASRAGDRKLRNGVLIRGCDCTKRNGLPVDCLCEKPAPEIQNVNQPKAAPVPHLQRSPVTCPPQRCNPNTCPQQQQQCPPVQQYAQRPIKTCIEQQQERMNRGLPPMECPIQTPLPNMNNNYQPGSGFQSQFPPMQMRPQPISPIGGGMGQHVTQPFSNMPPTYTQANCECPSQSQQQKQQPPIQQHQPPPQHHQPPPQHHQAPPQQHQAPPQQHQTPHPPQMQQGMPNNAPPPANANPNQANLNLNEAQCYHFLTSQGQLKPLPIPGTFQHVQPMCQCEGQPQVDYGLMPTRPLPCTEHRYDIPCSYCLHSY